MNQVFRGKLTKREEKLMALAWDDIKFADLFPKDTAQGSTGNRFEQSPEQIYEEIIQAAKEVRDKSS